MTTIKREAYGLTVIGIEPFGFDKSRTDFDLIMVKNAQQVALWEARVKERKQGFGQVLELGIRHGGSIPYLSNLCQADFIVGVDIVKEDPSIREVLDGSALAGQYELYFETEQTDEIAIPKIIEKHFSNGLDMVVDDASHLLDETRRSFELLFPKVKPGGLYVIEDYAWAQNESFAYLAEDRFRNKPATIQIVLEITMLMTTQKDWVSKVSCDFNTITVERGKAEIPNPFFLRKNIMNWAGWDLE